MGKLIAKPLWLYLAARFALYLGVGALLSSGAIFVLLVASDGMEPEGLCDFVEGQAGALGLDSGVSGYRCVFDVAHAAGYVALLTPILAVPGIMVTWFASMLWRMAPRRTTPAAREPED